MRRWEEVQELMWSFFSFLEGGLLVMSQISARTLRPLLLYRHWRGDHRRTGTTARKKIWKHSSVTPIIPVCGEASRPPWCPLTGASPRCLEENNKQVGGLLQGVACAPRTWEGLLPFPPTWLKAGVYGCVCPVNHCPPFRGFPSSHSRSDPDAELLCGLLQWRLCWFGFKSGRRVTCVVRATWNLQDSVRVHPSSIVNIPFRPTPIGIVRHEPVSLFNKTWRAYTKKFWKPK